MIELFISQRPVVIPEDLSFTFIYENPYFTSNGNSSYNIELPLADCQQNIRIFGHLHRLWSKKSRLTYSAELRDNGCVMLIGTAVVNEVTNERVKLQLIAGNSEFNFRTAKSYINQLDLGSIKMPSNRYPGVSAGPIEASEKINYYGSIDQIEAVWNPVKCNDKYYNRMILEMWNDKFYPTAWPNDVCVQPYLITVLRKLVTYFGYTIGLNDIEDSFLRNLYIVSAVQTYNIANVLPKWTMAEFLDELEKFCSIITVVDEEYKTVNFISLSLFFDKDDAIIIDADDVLEEYQVDISDDNTDKDTSNGNLSYDLPSLQENKFLKFDEKIVDMALMHSVPSYDQIGVFFSGLSKDDRYKYLVTCLSRQYICYNEGTDEDVKETIKEVNLFRDLIRDAEKDIDVKLKIVPAAIEAYNTPYYVLFEDVRFDVAPAGYVKLNVPVSSYDSPAPKDAINIQKAIEGDEEYEATSDNNKDILEVALNTGLQRVRYKHSGGTFDHEYPCPFTDYQQVVPNMISSFPQYSLSLYNVGVSNCIGYRFQTSKKISSNVAYKISFRRRHIKLDPKKVYIIANQMYQCERLEVIVDSDGFSDVVEGTFYRVE